jgi:hypothetical protein
VINTIPVVGWLIDILFKMCLAVPFWFMWTVCGLGEKYFYFLPPVYHAPGFWNCVGLFVAVPILYLVFVPRLISVNNTQKVGTSEKKEKKKSEDDKPVEPDPFLDGPLNPKRPRSPR